MTAPLDGIRVIEVANWLAAPSAAALMCDLGAEVIKVEPPRGDILRHFDMRTLGYPRYDRPLNSAFELDNRGKRSICVALDRDGGPQIVHRLIKDADILVLNLTPPRRRRYRLTEDEARAINPKLIYASMTGYGTTGPDADRPGFDYAAFWARSGIMSSIGQPPSPPPVNRPGQGDHTACLSLLASVLAALRLRDMTGKGQSVDVTLQITGMWTIGADLSAALIAKQSPPRHDRTEPPNPIWNTYQTRDERWLLLVMPQPEPYWPRFCEMMNEPTWTGDERYATAAARRTNTRQLTAAISAHFAREDLAYWSKRLDEIGLIWAPVLDYIEATQDAQARAMGLFTTLEHPMAGAFETLSTPFGIAGADIGPRCPAPAIGQHTAEILGEIGLSTGEIERLRAAGVVGPSA